MRFSHACLLLFMLLVGCHGKPLPKVQPQQENYFIQELQTYLIPPAGWSKPDIERTDDHIRYAWVSPTDSTAVGVVYFHAPIPVTYDIAIWGFLQEMKAHEGAAELLEQHWDIDSQSMRFVAEGGLFRMRVKMVLDGTTGWAIFAGTKTDRPVSDQELQQAIIARDYAKILSN